MEGQAGAQPDKPNEAPAEKPKRKRIYFDKKPGTPVHDPLAFTKNKSSEKARIIFTEEENLRIELWFDKHYHDRHHQGDESGQRDGIGFDVVEELVRRSIKHMLLYCSLVKGFSFLNRDIAPHERPLRIVLQEQTDNGLLNVVIEAHFIELAHYQITVKTAMCKDDYELSDNQYSIELTGAGNSILFKKDVKVVNEICSI